MFERPGWVTIFNALKICKYAKILWFLYNIHQLLTQVNLHLSFCKSSTVSMRCPVLSTISCSLAMVMPCSTRIKQKQNTINSFIFASAHAGRYFFILCRPLVTKIQNNISIIVIKITSIFMQIEPSILQIFFLTNTT